MKVEIILTKTYLANNANNALYFHFWPGNLTFSLELFDWFTNDMIIIICKQQLPEREVPVATNWAGEKVRSKARSINTTKPFTLYIRPVHTTKNFPIVIQIVDLIKRNNLGLVLGHLSHWLLCSFVAKLGLFKLPISIWKSWRI